MWITSKLELIAVNLGWVDIIFKLGFITGANPYISIKHCLLGTHCTGVKMDDFTNPYEAL